TVSDVSYVNSPTIPRDRLVDTNPALGSTVSYGATVALKMSSGEVEVPDVRGMTENEARNTLESEDLGLSLQVRAEETDDHAANRSYQPSVRRGDNASHGQSIAVVIAIPAPEPSPTETESEEPSPTESEEPSPTESESEDPSPSESESDDEDDESSESPSESPSDDES